MAKDKKEFTRQEKDWVINDVFHSTCYDESINKLGFKSRLAFDRYLKTDPEFQAEIKQAELDACTYLENDMLNVHRRAKGDHKLARVLLEAYAKILAYRNPAKYSQKLDLTVTQVSMKTAIDGANDRVKSLLKDVVEIEALQISGEIEVK